MKVKNGIASSKSFDNMPVTRCGIACRNDGVKKPSSIAMTPKNKPSAANVNATG